MTPDRAEASADDCLSLAARLDSASGPDLVRIADQLLWIPRTHPLRDYDDKVLQMSERIRRRDVTAEELTAFAGELRDGRDAMIQTGWYRLMFSGASSQSAYFGGAAQHRSPVAAAGEK